MIAQGVPAHADVGFVLAFLDSKRVDHGGTESNTYGDRAFFDGSVLRKGDRYVSASVMHASWGFWCSNTLTAYFVLVDDRVDRVIYEEWGDGCP